MLFGGKTASSLLICAGVVACFTPAGLAAERGNAADFDGVWSTVVPEYGARYKLILRVDGETVTGDFLGADPKFSGTLTGTVDPSLDGTASGGRLEYTYVQPQVAGSGGGYFIVGDDGTIAGLTYTDEEPSKKFGWEGKRTSKKVGGKNNADIRTVGENGTTVYADAEGAEETGDYLSSGDKVTVVKCYAWSCKISAPVKGYVDKEDLGG